MVEQLISNGMLEELDKDALTNLGNIGEQYLNPSYDPGNVYSVPYQGGVAAIAVNTDVIKDDITSYADLFDEKYANTMVVLDDYRAVIGMASKSLGYSLNPTDTTELDAVKTQLLKLKNNIKLYDSDSPKSALISGDCSLGYAWSAEIALANAENPAIQIVFPTEGCYVFMDNWCITKGAKNSENATKFINYMLEADPMVKVAEEFPYLNPNTAAVEKLGDEYKNNEAKNPPAEVITNGEYVANLDTDTLKIYDEMWTELKK